MFGIKPSIRHHWSSAAEVPSAGARRSPSKLAYAAIAVWSLATLLTQFQFRHYDDNRLTSWAWVFTAADIQWLLPAHIAALLLAFLLAKSELPGRWPGTLLFFLSCAVAIPFWSEPEVILDASRYFTQAKHLELYGLQYFLREWGGQIGAWTDLPLIPLLYGLIFSVAGESRITIQMFTTLLFATSVALTYRIGRTLWDETTGFHAGALLLGMPYLLTQVPLMLVDVPTMFFLVLALFATLKALELHGSGRLALAAVAIALAFWTKYSAWLFLSVLPLALVVRSRQEPGSAIPSGLALVMLSMLLIGATLLPMWDAVGTQLSLLRSYQLPGLARWGESAISTFLFQTHPFIAAAALVSVYAGWRNRDAAYVIVLWLPALVVLTGINRIRYILPVLPMLALMAAYGLREIRCEQIRNYVILCIVASSLTVSVFGFGPFLQRTSAVNLQQAGKYLDSLDVSEVEVITLSQRYVAVNPAVSVPLLDMHTTRRLVSCSGQPATMGESVEESPLRFTWQKTNPAYYRCSSSQTKADAVVVIADDDAQSLPAHVEQRLIGYRRSKQFIASERIYGYRTIVKVYAVAHYEKK